MQSHNGVEIGQKWEDTENGERDFIVTAIEIGGEEQWTTSLSHGTPSGINITFSQHEQDGMEETVDYNEFMDWAESNCYSPKINGEAFWLQHFHRQTRG